ncbi:hypothetical protein WMF30_09430 [Sorangium sp. So ce134]
MRLILDRALFAPQSAREALDLVQILATAAEDPQHHAVQTDPPYVLGANNQEVDAWLGQRGPEEAAGLQAVLASGNIVAAMAPRVGRAQDQAVSPWWHIAESFDVVVERRAASDWPNLRLTLRDALDLLQEPVHLVLENEWNDFAFVAHLAGPTDGPVLRALKATPGRLHVHGGGGSAAKTWLNAVLDQPLTAEKWRRVLRAWVLFDQDAGDADVREPSADAGRMRQVCEQVQVAYAHRLSWACLRRREIESYVPDAGLQAIQAALPARAPMLQKILDWRRDPAFVRHAWAFDFKKGLRGDLGQHVAKPVRDAVKNGQSPLGAAMLKVPFAALPPQEVTTLESGLGDRYVNQAYNDAPPWTAGITAEYDRGPHGQAPDPDQAPRVGLIQTLIDRI